MGLKDLFIQKEEPEIPDYVPSFDTEINSQQNVETPNIGESLAEHTESLLNFNDLGLSDPKGWIDSVYSKLNLSNTAVSIDKASDIRNNLPDTLTFTDKYNSVIGMLKVMNLDVNDLIADANTKISAIKESTSELVASIEATNADIDIQIEGLKEQIKNLQNTKERLGEYDKEINAHSNAELERLNELTLFLAGPNGRNLDGSLHNSNAQ